MSRPLRMAVLFLSVFIFSTQTSAAELVHFKSRQKPEEKSRGKVLADKALLYIARPSSLWSEPDTRIWTFADQEFLGVTILSSYFFVQLAPGTRTVWMEQDNKVSSPLALQLEAGRAYFLKQKLRRDGSKMFELSEITAGEMGSYFRTCRHVSHTDLAIARSKTILEKANLSNLAEPEKILEEEYKRKWKEGLHYDFVAGYSLTYKDNYPSLDKNARVDLGVYLPLDKNLTGGFTVPSTAGHVPSSSPMNPEGDINFLIGYIVPTLQYTPYPHKRFSPYGKAAAGFGGGDWASKFVLGMTFATGAGLEIHLTRHWSLLLETKLDYWRLLNSGTEDDILLWNQTVGFRWGNLSSGKKTKPETL